MITEFFKIMAICLIAAVICIVLKPKSGEYAFGVSVVAGIVILTVIFKNIAVPIKELSQKVSD